MIIEPIITYATYSIFFTCPSRYRTSIAMTLAIVPTIDPKETILKTEIVNTANIKEGTPDKGDKIINPTTPVSTPLPPRNFAVIGQI